MNYNIFYPYANLENFTSDLVIFSHKLRSMSDMVLLKKNLYPYNDSRICLGSFAITGN